MKRLVNCRPIMPWLSVCSIFEGVGYVEIAELMRIPIGTVKTYLHRGKRALREIITGKYSPEELL